MMSLAAHPAGFDSRNAGDGSGYHGHMSSNVEEKTTQSFVTR